MVFLLFIGGLVALLMGAELLVRGASRLGAIVGISPLVIGLTIVAFGTSSPEMAISVRAALTNHSDLIIGANIGSTIFNLLFILGLCALISPLIVSQRLVWYEVPIMIGAHLTLLIMCLDGKLDRINGLILFMGIIVYTIFAIYKGRKENTIVTNEYRTAFSSVAQSNKTITVCKNVGLIIAGLIFCVLGADYLVDSAVIFARTLGVSELVIGMTIVAAGTSLPETATSLVATIRGQKDIAIGNVVGSCIFNVLGNIGLAGIIAPHGITIAPSVLRFDLPVAIASSIACLPIFFTGHKISRWEGALFLGYYIAFVSYLVLAARNHDSIPLFSAIMLWFVVPLTIVTIVVVQYREYHKR